MQRISNKLTPFSGPPYPAPAQACNDCVELAQSQGRRWSKMLQHERDQRSRLEELVEQLGKQHSNLEKQVRKSLAHPLGGPGAGGGSHGQGGGAGRCQAEGGGNHGQAGGGNHSPPKYGQAGQYGGTRQACESMGLMT